MLFADSILILIISLCVGIELVILLPLGILLIIDGHVIAGALFIGIWIFYVYELRDTYKEEKDKWQTHKGHH